MFTACMHLTLCAGKEDDIELSLEWTESSNNVPFYFPYSLIQKSIQSTFLWRYLGRDNVIDKCNHKVLSKLALADTDITENLDLADTH